jgi:hypothetical protein
MFLFVEEAFSSGGGFGTFTLDINFGPGNIAANADLSAFFTTGGTGFAGFNEFTTVDQNGVPTENTLGSGDFFECTPVLFANSVITVTFFFGVGDTGGLSHMAATCQVFFFDQSGNLS